MKLIAVVMTLFFTCFSFAGFRAWQNDTSVGLFNALKCDSSLKCSRDGSKMKISQVGASAVSVAVSSGSVSALTASQCGSYFVNAGPATLTLPAASSAAGCIMRFVTGQASTFAVDPAGTDQILVLTNAAGDKITNATLGNTVSLLAYSNAAWVVIGEKGTWADGN